MKRTSTAILMLLALLTACRCVIAGSRAYGELSASGVRMCAADAAAATATDTDELPLPAVPSSLREPSARASYILDHFWDAMDFADTLRSHNARFMEQAFSNFIAVFPYAGGQSCREAVGTLMRRAEADSTAYVLLADIAEKYLYETASPFFSEEHYIMFLEHLADSPVLGEYGTLRPRRQLEAASRNRPGTVAANFIYTACGGRRMTLHRTSSAASLLLIFYDPDCDHCREVLNMLRDDDVLADKVAAGDISVLALYSGARRALWEQTAGEFPAEWTVGYESGRLQENGTYVLHTMPALYLLDAENRVVLKEPSAERLLSLLHAGE